MMKTTVNDGIESVAIIGMAGRFPLARNLAEFWENLREGVECVSAFTDEELVSAGVDPVLLADSNYIKAKAVLEECA